MAVRFVDVPCRGEVYELVFGVGTGQEGLGTEVRSMDVVALEADFGLASDDGVGERAAVGVLRTVQLDTLLLPWTGWSNESEKYRSRA